MLLPFALFFNVTITVILNLLQLYYYSGDGCYDKYNYIFFSTFLHIFVAIIFFLCLCFSTCLTIYIIMFCMYITITQKLIHHSKIFLIAF